MEKLFKAEVSKKVDELIALLKDSYDYQRYVQVSEKMKNDKEIMSLIEEVKANQKKIVNLEYRGEDTKDLESDIEKKLLQLDSYPIYKEYSYLVDDLNSLFQNIKNILEDYINKKIN